MDEIEITQNRSARRSQRLMTAALDVSGRMIDVTLRNLSSDGAQVEGGGLPVEGTKLLFCKGELALPATIIWTKAKQAGIHFDQKLDPATVLNHVPAPRPRIAGDFRRPGLSSPRLTDRERALAKNWIATGPSPIVGD